MKPDQLVQGRQRSSFLSTLNPHWRSHQLFHYTICLWESQLVQMIKLQAFSHCNAFTLSSFACWATCSSIKLETNKLKYSIDSIVKFYSRDQRGRSMNCATISSSRDNKNWFTLLWRMLGKVLALQCFKFCATVTSKNWMARSISGACSTILKVRFPLKR